MFNFNAKTGLAVFASLGLTLAPTLSQAADFTPEGAANWSGIARSLTVAIDSGNEHTAVCNGINAFAAMHADFRQEVMTTRDWAPRAHVQMCVGLAAEGKAIAVKCRTYRTAVSELAKADPAKDPADVVATATMLKDSLNSILAEFHDAGLC